MTPEEARNQAKAQSAKSAETQVAVYLKQSWAEIKLAGAKLKKNFKDEPTNEEFSRMAGELISEKRGFTLDGQTLSIDELDQAADQSIKDKLKIKSFHQLIPTRKQIDLISEEVGKGVEENTG